MLAKATSKELMKAASVKKPPEIPSSTCCVTSRYMRLKQAMPSPGGSACSMCSICEIASATDATGGHAGGRSFPIARRR